MNQNTQTYKMNKFFAIIFTLLTITAFAALVSPPVSAQGVFPRLVSATSTGTTAPGNTRDGSLSSDGRYVAFETEVSTMIAGVTDTNNQPDIFLRDLRTGSIKCLSCPTPTTTGTAGSYDPLFSANGRYILFITGDDDIAPNDSNGRNDLVRYDMATGQTELVSVNAAGTNGGNGSITPAIGVYKTYDISADGRYIAFLSVATDMVTGITDTNSQNDVFVRDMVAGTTQLASKMVSAASTGLGAATDVNISADGKIITFQSSAENLTSVLDENAAIDVFVKNMSTGTLKLASFRHADPTRSGDGIASGPVLSKDGRRVAYTTTSRTTVPNDTDIDRDALVYDIALNTNVLVSVNAAGTASGNGTVGLGFPENVELAISDNGRYVFFDTNQNDIATPPQSDGNNGIDVYRRDIDAGITEIVSLNSGNNNAGTGPSLMSGKKTSISPDGRFIGFESAATNLLAGVFPVSGNQLFVRDMKTQITFIVTIKPDGSGSASGTGDVVSFSSNGKAFTFQSVASNLSSADTTSTLDVYVARPHPGTSVSDFDGDNRSDFVVFRASQNAWYTLPNTGNYIAGALVWGTTGDIAVPADYSGDGRSDYAVYRPSNGTWYSVNSSNFNTEMFQFGEASDKPLAADFDGDGKADRALFRPSNGTWYISQSSNGQLITQAFGLNDDIPVLADFDGDGKTDITVFRPSNGTWYILLSTNGQIRVDQFGISGDKPVPADFDSDGKADLCVFRAGIWHRMSSRHNQYTTIAFGIAGDIPVVADYDGDSVPDYAVFRPADGNWYMIHSASQETQILHFGQNGDVPAAGAFAQ